MEHELLVLFAIFSHKLNAIFIAVDCAKRMRWRKGRRQER